MERSKELFIRDHYKKYGNKERPPAYKTLEVVSFGCLSKIYSNLDNQIPSKNRIAQEFNLPNHRFLSSWLKSFNTIRNIIAHHSRLWNRSIDFPPRSLYKTNYDFIDIPDNKHSIYHCISSILFTLNKVSRGHSIKERMIALLNRSEFVSASEMGFPEKWRVQAIWN